MTWTDAERFLIDLPRFADAGPGAYKPGLDRMQALLAALGDPHTRFRSVHIAGTNGKGSTASMIAAIGTAAGLKTGLHTSPHLYDLAERMRIDGVPAPHDWLAEAVARHCDAFEIAGPSFFEATVALSFLYFAEQAVDLAVVEVGLGGRLDATNVLRPALALVTHIGLDHLDLLGPTAEDVAREKAGIAKPGVPLLSAAEGESVVATLRATAEGRDAHFVHLWDEVTLDAAPGPDGTYRLDLTTPVRRYDGLAVGLPGAHQVANAALAVRAAEHVLADGASQEAVREGLAKTTKLSGLGGRCEILQRAPFVLADVAHNADGLRSTLVWARSLVEGSLYVLFGAMRDKDLGAMADLLGEAGAVVLPVGLPSPRAVPSTDLQRLFERAGLRTVAVADPAAGAAWFHRHAGPDDGLLATGSHLTAASLVPLVS